MVAEREPSPDVRASRTDGALDRLVTAASWIWLGLVGVIVAGVLLRTLFGVSRIELEELQWHLYAVGFLVGIVGCAVHDRHVRVDVFRERMAPRRRDWVDLYGLLLFQLPFLVLVIWSGLPLVAESFASNERSASAGGLSHRWILKSVLPLSFGLLIAASLARLLAVARRLFLPRADPGDAPRVTPAPTQGPDRP